MLSLSEDLPEGPKSGILTPVDTTLTFGVIFSIVLKFFNRKFLFHCGLRLMCNVSNLLCALPALGLFSSVRFPI